MGTKGNGEKYQAELRRVNLRQQGGKLYVHIQWMWERLRYEHGGVMLVGEDEGKLGDKGDGALSS